MQRCAKIAAQRRTGCTSVVVFLILTSCAPDTSLPQIDLPGVARIQTVPDIPIVDASWSSDSRSLVITSIESLIAGPRSEVYLIEFPDGKSSHLSESMKLFNAQRPQLSPDNQQVAFSAENDVLRMRVDTQEIVFMTKASGAVWSPIWDEVALWNAAACGWKFGDASSICILNVETGKRRIIYTSTRHFVFGGMDWSQDGTRLAVSFEETHMDAVDSQRRIHIFDLQSGSHVPITPESSDAFDPAWSADDEYIAYVQSSGRSVEDRLMIVRLNDSCLAQIISARGLFDSPDWSSDGKWISFVYNADLYSIDLNEPAIKNAFEAPDCLDVAP